MEVKLFRLACAFCALGRFLSYLPVLCLFWASLICLDNGFTWDAGSGSLLVYNLVELAATTIGVFGNSNLHTFSINRTGYVGLATTAVEITPMTYFECICTLAIERVMMGEHWHGLPPSVLLCLLLANLVIPAILLPRNLTPIPCHKDRQLSVCSRILGV